MRVIYDELYTINLSAHGDLCKTIYYVTLRMFTMSIQPIILTLSPVVSIVVSLILIGTFPGVQDLLGGMLILAGVVVVTRGK